MNEAPPISGGPKDPLPPGSVRVERPGGARRIIPERDFLSGPTTLHERHRRQRACLIPLLWDEPPVRTWRTRWDAAFAPLYEPFIAWLDEFTRTAGAPSRAAFFIDEPTITEEHRAEFVARFDRLHDEMEHALPAGSGFQMRLELEEVVLALNRQLQFPKRVRSWIALELMGRFLDEQDGTLAGARVRRVTTVRLLSPYTTTVRLHGASPAAIARHVKEEAERVQAATREGGRMPREDPYLERDMTWLVQNRLQGKSLSALGRDYRPGDPNARQAVRNAIKKVERWLAEATPEPEPAPARAPAPASPKNNRKAKNRPKARDTKTPKKSARRTSQRKPRRRR